MTFDLSSNQLIFDDKVLLRDGDHHKLTNKDCQPNYTQVVAESNNFKMGYLKEFLSQQGDILQNHQKRCSSVKTTNYVENLSTSKERKNDDAPNKRERSNPLAQNLALGSRTTGRISTSNSNIFITNMKILEHNNKEKNKFISNIDFLHRNATSKRNKKCSPSCSKVTLDRWSSTGSIRKGIPTRSSMDSLPKLPSRIDPIVPVSEMKNSFWTNTLDNEKDDGTKVKRNFLETKSIVNTTPLVEMNGDNHTNDNKNAYFTITVTRDHKALPQRRVSKRNSCFDLHSSDFTKSTFRRYDSMNDVAPKIPLRYY